jgi:hypothetical protein
MGRGQGNRTATRSTTVTRTETRSSKADLRVSDADRDRVIDMLRAHAGEGRLTVDELDERIDAALAARTNSDLAVLTKDLPRVKRSDPDRERREFREHLRIYLSVMTLLVVIWALTGADYFWPVWPALGWGIGVLSHAGSVRGRRTRRLPASTS